MTLNMCEYLQFTVKATEQMLIFLFELHILLLFW